MLIGIDGVRKRFHGQPPALMGTAAVLVVMVGAAVAWAQGAATRPTGSVSLTERRPRYTRTTPVTDALLGAPRKPAVILPSQPGTANANPDQSSQDESARLAGDKLLLPEGYMVAARRARISRHDRWYVVEPFETQGLPDAPPLRVLPNRQLALLEAVLSGARGPTGLFIVTGRVTEFEGANYILIEILEEVSARPVVPESSMPADPGPTATSPADQREPTAEEIMRKLLQHETARPVVLPDLSPVDEGPGAADTGNDSSPAEARRKAALPEDTLLVDRAGRLLPGEVWWTFVFEDQGRQPKRAPVRLLPSRLLESAIDIAGGGTQGVVLIVSGEMTLHRGTNYLLLRKVLVRRDMGNFR